VQAKTVKECTAEWRAAKDDFQAKGVTQKAYVADCRAGKTTENPESAPATPAAVPPAPQASPPPTRRATPTVAPAPSGTDQFTTEAEAKARCSSDLVVWVNLKSRIYHFSGTKNYGNTKEGVYMCEKDATGQGNRASKTEKRPAV
jgi:hypothetical protein